MHPRTHFHHWLIPAVALAGLAFLLALAGLWFYLSWNNGARDDFSFSLLLEDIGRLHPLVYFSIMALAPAMFLPVAPFLVVAGWVYSLPTALIGSALAMLVNLVLVYWGSRKYLRPMAEWVVNRLGKSIPSVRNDEFPALVLLVRLTPGTPFCLQSVLLGLAGVPFRLYVLLSWPLVMSTGALFVLFGESAMQGRMGLVLFIAGVLLALILGLRLGLRRLALRKVPAAELQGEDSRSSKSICP